MDVHFNVYAYIIKKFVMKHTGFWMFFSPSPSPLQVPSVSVSVPIMRVAAPLHTIPESLLHLFSTDA